MRKERAGLSKTSHCRDGYNQGIYSPDFTRNTYREMFERAEEILSDGRAVVLDASFSRRADRAEAAALARRKGVRFMLFHALCPDEVTRERLEAREEDAGEVSDGRWELFSRQKNDFEPLLSPGENREEIDTSVPVEESIVRILRIVEGRTA